MKETCDTLLAGSRVRLVGWCWCRSEAHVDSSTHQTIEAGSGGTVLAGPVPHGGRAEFVWWRIVLDDGRVSWIEAGVLASVKEIPRR